MFLIYQFNSFFTRSWRWMINFSFLMDGSCNFHSLFFHNVVFAFLILMHSCLWPIVFFLHLSSHSRVCWRPVFFVFFCANFVTICGKFFCTNYIGFLFVHNVERRRLDSPSTEFDCSDTSPFLDNVLTAVARQISCRISCGVNLKTAVLSYDFSLCAVCLLIADIGFSESANFHF